MICCQNNVKKKRQIWTRFRNFRTFWSQNLSSLPRLLDISLILTKYRVIIHQKKALDKPVQNLWSNSGYQIIRIWKSRKTGLDACYMSTESSCQACLEYVVKIRILTDHLDLEIRKNRFWLLYVFVFHNSHKCDEWLSQWTNSQVNRHPWAKVLSLV